MRWLSGTIFLLLSAGVAHAAWSPALVTVPKGQLAPFWGQRQKQSGAIEVIEVQSFQVMTAPVTNAEFQNFLREDSEWSKSKVKRIFADEGYLEQFENKLKLKRPALAAAPVTAVSWFAARAFCERYGMRLPMVAEWEYIGVASETKANASRDPEFLQTILDWYSEPRAKSGLHSVRRGRPNLYGIYDLHSLIWEWVEDFNSSLQQGEGRGEGSLNKDLFCGAGGASGANKEDYAAYMRFAFRSSLKGSSTVWNLGFRCIKDLPK